MSENGNGSVTWAAFWRAVVYGIVFLIGLSGGAIAWAFNVSQTGAIREVKITDHERRILVIESKLDGMDGKLDQLLERSGPKKR